MVRPPLIKRPHGSGWESAPEESRPTGLWTRGVGLAREAGGCQELFSVSCRRSLMRERASGDSVTSASGRSFSISRQ